MSSTIDAIKDQPGLAKIQFRARNIWDTGGRNRSIIKEFYGAGQEDSTRTAPFVLDADEPPVLLGEDRGANPVEFVLHALAACLTTSPLAVFTSRGWNPSSRATSRLAWVPGTFGYREKGVSEHPCWLQSQARRARGAVERALQIFTGVRHRVESCTGIHQRRGGITAFLTLPVRMVWRSERPLQTFNAMDECRSSSSSRRMVENEHSTGSLSQDAHYLRGNQI